MSRHERQHMFTHKITTTENNDYKRKIANVDYLKPIKKRKLQIESNNLSLPLTPSSPSNLSSSSSSSSSSPSSLSPKYSPNMFAIKMAPPPQQQQQETKHNQLWENTTDNQNQNHNHYANIHQTSTTNNCLDLYCKHKNELTQFRKKILRIFLFLMPQIFQYFNVDINAYENNPDFLNQAQTDQIMDYLIGVTAFNNIYNSVQIQQN